MDRKSILKSFDETLGFAVGYAKSILNAQLENLERSEDHNKFLRNYVNYVNECIKENRVPMNIHEWNRSIEE